MGEAAIKLQDVSLEDKYTLEEGRIYLSGIQALVRLPMMQKQRDAAAGKDTGAYISGYRGSPLGAFDQQLWAAKKFLARNDIVFQPGVNEDLAATAIWGSQQLNLYPDAEKDGVFAMWYGKGPGVDRCGDVFKHANMAGTSPWGGVLALAGDDHACRSSTLPHQSEHAFVAAMMPVLYPATVQDFLDYGLYGWAMSRYSGCWIGFKTVAETVESSASVVVDPHRVDIKIPDFEMPEGGVNIRWPDFPTDDQELRMQKYKLYGALAFARANKLDKTVIDSPNARLGIITAGKSYLDVRQAFDDLGLTEELAAEIGIRLYKVAMPWPLEKEGIREFAQGLDEVLVVEEKRALIENQLKEQLYNWDPDTRPRVVGKFDEGGDWLLPSTGELTPAKVARVIAARIEKFHGSDIIRERLAFLDDKDKELKDFKAPMSRVPYFCSGCPHNSSTKVPEGSRAMAGIGCHFMSIWMDRSTETFTHMGGEGVTWLGQSPFSKTDHVFTNLGDGTYYHSGMLAIRAAIAGKVNITYKILYNDAVAMTGGQPHDGELTVPQITHQMAAEGVQKIVIVTDEPDKYPAGVVFADGVDIHHRDRLDDVQKSLREWPGVSILIYDQTCAAEKRRRRKRGTFPDPAKRAFINERVCEGCGHCSEVSNCVSVIPVETEFGRKRAIDQSSCNKDYSCVEGFCPSFVSVEGGRLRKQKQVKTGETDIFPVLPEPTVPEVGDLPFGILVTGVGGTGVVTIGQLLGMAAHLENKGVSVLDQAGLAQKGGAVTSHVRIGRKPEDIHAVRIAAGEANLVLGCDIVTAAGADALAKVREGLTYSVVNVHETITGDFTRNPDLQFPTEAMKAEIIEETGAAHVDFIEGTRLATSLMGDSIATNLFMLGYAWQRGQVPLSGAALERAIELNGVAVEANKRAFLWGRRAAHDVKAVEAVARPPAEFRDRPVAETLDEAIEIRMRELTVYQNAAYAGRYKALVGRVREAEAKVPGASGLTETVARYYYKLLAYKDEYEVARFYSDGEFLRRVHEQFEGDFRIKYHLAPPTIAQRDPSTGHLKKREFGPWMMTGFRVLASLKGLRGTILDPFGRSADRKLDRKLIADYERNIGAVLDGLDAGNHELGVAIARLPEHIRGYGHIREGHLEKVQAEEKALLAAFADPSAARAAAE